LAYPVNPAVLQTDIVEHGSTFDHAILDFSASIICQPLPLEKLLTGLELHRYPDSESTAFKSAAAGFTGLKVENILPGSGSSEIFLYLALAYINNESRVGALEPAYGEYRRVTQLAGGTCLTFKLAENNDFKIDLQLLQEWVERERIDVFFLTNPNNPTGQLLKQDDLLQLLAEFPRVLFIIDLAYHDYTGEKLDYRRLTADNVFLVHSLTKNCGLAGLRCGFTSSTAENIMNLNRIRLPWNLNSLAQAAGCWVLENHALCLRKVSELKQEADSLRNFIAGSGYSTIASQTDYFLVKCENPDFIASELLKRGIKVRNTASQGLPGYLRITVKEPEQNLIFRQRWLEICVEIGCNQSLRLNCDKNKIR